MAGRRLSSCHFLLLRTFLRKPSMIRFDLHNHTFYSHGANSVTDMYKAALAKGLSVYGFTEHSPRPERYTYPTEYRDRLNAHLSDYVREVAELKQEQGPCRVLFGMEIDWFEEDQDFVRRAATQFPFDYLLGSTHFLGTWGFDAGPEPWEAMDGTERFSAYTAYFAT